MQILSASLWALSGDNNKFLVFEARSHPLAPFKVQNIDTVTSKTLIVYGD